jgi:predicted MFS family arabinose efflux permease
MGFIGPARLTRAMPATLTLFAALFAIGIDNYIIAAILPQIGLDLGESIATVGLLASAYALPNAFLAPVFGPLSDRFGRKVMMAGGMVLFVLAAAGSAVAPTFGVLLAVRVLNGLGAAIVIPAATAYASEAVTDAERPRALSRLLAAYPSSTLLGVPLGAFVAAVVGWRGAFWLVTAFAVVSLAFLLRLASDRARPGVVMGYGQSLGLIVRNPRSAATLLVLVIWMGAALGNFTYVGAFLQREYDMPVEHAGLVFIIVGVMGTAATRLGGRFISVVGPKRAVLTGISAFAFAAFVLPFTVPLLPLSLAVFATWVFGTWFGLPAMWTIISNLHPSARGTLLAFGSSALYLGGVIGPAVSGRVLEIGDFTLLGPWNSLLAVMAFVLALVVLPGRIPQSDPQAVEAPAG